MTHLAETNQIITTAHEALNLSDRRRAIASIILRAPREVVEAVERAMKEAVRDD